MRSVTEIKKVKKQAPEKPSTPRKKAKPKPKVDLSLIEKVLEGIDTNARDIFLPVLRRTQEVYGFIPREAVTELAKRLKTTPAHLYGVATFYDQFSLAPQGRNVIRLCTNMACNVNRAEALLSFLRDRLKITKGNTTADGRYTVIESECIGSCGRAPAMMINDDFHYDLTPQKIEKILARYK